MMCPCGKREKGVGCSEIVGLIVPRNNLPHLRFSHVYKLNILRCCRMRTYKRKTNRGTTSEELSRRAADVVIKEERKIKIVARDTVARIPDLQTFSPEIVKPFPRAPLRSQKVTKRRIRKTAVLTDTPEKNALAEEQSKNKRKMKIRTVRHTRKKREREGKREKTSITGKKY